MLAEEERQALQTRLIEIEAKMEELIQSSTRCDENFALAEKQLQDRILSLKNDCDRSKAAILEMKANLTKAKEAITNKINGVP